MTGKQRMEEILLNVPLIQGEKSTLRIIVPVPQFFCAQMAEH